MLALALGAATAPPYEDGRQSDHPARANEPTSEGLPKGGREGSASDCDQPDAQTAILSDPRLSPSSFSILNIRLKGLGLTIATMRGLGFGHRDQARGSARNELIVLGE